jgi:hypothetical protein
MVWLCRVSRKGQEEDEDRGQVVDITLGFMHVSVHFMPD